MLLLYCEYGPSRSAKVECRHSFNVDRSMDGDQIRKTLLEVVDDLSKRPNTYLQSGWILQEAITKLALPRSIDYQRALLACLHDLFRLGYFAWGADLSNSAPSFFHVTEQGRRTLASIIRDPANPEGYLQYIQSKNSLSPIAQAYVNEASSTYNFGCNKATAVMIGVASECVVLEVRDCLCARLDILQKPRPKNSRTGN